MTNVNVNEAGSHLPEIISGLSPGERVVIVQDGKPLAMLDQELPGPMALHGRKH